MPQFENYDPFSREWGIETAKPINLESITDPSPKNGDLWTDGTNLYFQMNGQTYQLATAGNPANAINYSEGFFLMGA